MFSRMRIGTRLGLGFGVVVLLLVIATGLGVTYITGLKANAEVVGLDKFPKTEIANKWVVAVLQVARHMRNVLILPDKAKIKEVIAAIREAQQERKAYMEELERSVHGEQ